MSLYVVTMHRWGDKELHSYLLGVYDNYAEALDAGIQEYEDRAHKYEPTIWNTLLNSNNVIGIKEPCLPENTTCKDCGRRTKPGRGSARCESCWDDRCG